MEDYWESEGRAIGVDLITFGKKCHPFNNNITNIFIPNDHEWDDIYPRDYLDLTTINSMKIFNVPLDISECSHCFIYYAMSNNNKCLRCNNVLSFFFHNDD